jgi:hypothetical protein
MSSTLPSTIHSPVPHEHIACDVHATAAKIFLPSCMLVLLRGHLRRIEDDTWRFRPVGKALKLTKATSSRAEEGKFRRDGRRLETHCQGD